jgi:diguanylate cyclase (GGDEF)-like protein
MIVDALEKNFMEEIKKLIEYDDRTKLLQIRPFYDRLEKSLEASDTKHTSISVLMLDLDGLKQINDKHGHLMGTEVIVRIANLISEEFAPSGIAAIYGGDEFSAYLENTTRAEAFERAERLRALVSELRFADKGIAERVTISIGIASYPGDGTEMMQLLANADRALYFAKAQGKNRVVVYDSDMAEPQG